MLLRPSKELTEELLRVIPQGDIVSHIIPCILLSSAHTCSADIPAFPCGFSALRDTSISNITGAVFGSPHFGSGGMTPWKASYCVASTCARMDVECGGAS